MSYCFTYNTKACQCYLIILNQAYTNKLEMNRGAYVCDFALIMHNSTSSIKTHFINLILWF